MKLAVSNIAWNAEQDEEMYEYICQNNIQGLEIAPTRIFPNNPYDNLEKAKVFSENLKNKYSLQICSMQSILFGRPERLFEGSEEERKNLSLYLKKALDFAYSINCSNLVFGSPKNRIIQNKEQYSIAIDFFRELGNYACQNNTILSIEANPSIYGTNFINTTQEAFRLVSEVDNKGFLVNIDLGTIIENDENIEIIAENIQSINHIHISEPHLALIEQRDIHEKLFQILIEQNYNKFVSLEMKNTGNLECIKSTLVYLRGLLQ